MEAEFYEVVKAVWLIEAWPTVGLHQWVLTLVKGVEQ